MLNGKEPLWESTSIQNLLRYRRSGMYFARFQVGGRRIRQSLETAVFSVAKQRLPEKIREYRSRYESFQAFAVGKMTVGDAVEVYLQKVRSDVSLKPRSKDCPTKFSRLNTARCCPMNNSSPRKSRKRVASWRR